MGGEAGNGDGDVIVNLEILLLVGGELQPGLVDAGEDSMGPPPEADGVRALLDGFHGILH